MKYNERVNIFKRIFPFFKRRNKLYCFLAILKVYSLACTLIPPFFYMLLINKVMIGKELNMLSIVIFGYICVFLLQILGVVLEKRTFNNFFSFLKIEIRKKILYVYTHLEVLTYSDYDIGDLKNRINDDMDKVEKFLNIHCLDYIYSVVSAVVIVGIMFYLNWMLAIIGIVVVPLSFYITYFMSAKSSKAANQYREEYGKYESYLHSAFTNWKEIKINCLESSQYSIMKEFWDVLSPLFVKQQIYWFISRGVIAFKDFFITKMNLYFVGGLLIINGNMNVGILLVFMNYYAQFFLNIEKITTSIIELRTERVSIDRVIEIIESEVSNKQKVIIIDDTISFQGVLFQYIKNQDNILNNINLMIHSKEHIAIVGRSGSGKTTLVKLLLGELAPTKGMITIGGFDISEISQESVGSKINAVMQEPYLFNLTIRENLLMALHNATDDQLDLACSFANIKEFINSLPKGYDTIIGENGVKLSGGQRQRLAIARAVLRNPDVIIFDESTSSLDYENEKAIMKSINALSANKTVITIAHRLSSIQNADKILVIDKGFIVDQGSYEDLCKESQIFQSLFSGQFML